MILRKNQYYKGDFKTGWIIQSYPYKLIYDNNSLELFNTATRKFNAIYAAMIEERFGDNIGNRPLLSLNNVPKNKIRFYFKSKEQFEIFKEILLIMKLTK